MKKKVCLFLAAVVLTTTALVTGPAKAAPGPTCHAPNCFRTPGCCQDSDCATFCAGREPGSSPFCAGECCECAVIL